jgi:hypothetical protein
MTKTPQNPWERLPRRPPFVLAEDQERIDKFNLSAELEHKIPLDIFPEPYLGRPKAPVVLLNLNPGHNARDLVHHRKALFAKRSRENLLPTEVDYPFYLIDPGLVPIRDRTAWWDKKLRRLLEEERLGNCADSRRKAVANCVFCVEYFPYHSKKFKHRKLQVDSQVYSFWLVREAIRREAVILLMRGEQPWYSAIPGLESYSGLHVSRSVQNPAISPANFPIGYSIAVDAIQRKRRQFG